jgi:hypothetical protein
MSGVKARAMQILCVIKKATFLIGENFVAKSILEKTCPAMSPSFPERSRSKKRPLKGQQFNIKTPVVPTKGRIIPIKIFFFSRKEAKALVLRSGNCKFILRVS